MIGQFSLIRLIFKTPSASDFTKRLKGFCISVKQAELKDLIDPNSFIAIGIIEVLSA